MNPRFGKEGDEDLIIKPAREKKKVMVVGGGPGGMEAARVAALRGHDVTLYEKSDNLGGQLNFLATTPNWSEWADVVKYFSTQLQKTKVKVECRKEVTAELVGNEKPDVVIVATGVKMNIPQIPGADGKNVVSVFEALGEKVTVGNKVAIWGGRHMAVYTADKLAAQGKDVTLVTDLPQWGRSISGTNMPGYMFRFEQNGVKTLSGASLEMITDAGMVITQEGKKQTIEVDTIIIATVKKNRQLAEELDVGKEFIVGDCRAPRRAFGAIHEGYAAGLKA
jgi:2,4-dienoyl-CoA reductase (NADPH2)